MLPEPQILYLPAEIPFSALEGRLAPGVRVCPESPLEIEWCFFDTFDGRLYRADLVLEERRDAEGTRAYLRQLASGRLLAELPGRVAGMVAELPASELRRQLEPVVQVRALLPLAKGRSRLEPADLLNEDGKTVGRLLLETPLLLSEKKAAPPLPLPRRLTVQPVRGYGEPCRALSDALRSLPGVTPASRELLVEALAVAGREPGGQAGKGALALALAPDLPACQAARQILLQLLEAMETNREGTLADWDTEFLHDFRVAVRRTRAALGQLRGIFQAEPLAHFRAEFRWLGQVTGPSRDFDVYLLNFPAYRAGLPEDYRDDLAPLHALLLAHRRQARHDLVAGLDSRRYQRLVAEWRQFLTTAADGEPLPENALRPIGALATARIRKLFSRVRKNGRRIDAEAPATDLHALRILCKKLRYLLEFFATLYPPKPVGRLIRTLKKLQDNLGAFQDLSVQTRVLAGFADELQKTGQVPVRTLLAMGMLIENLERRRETVRSEFAQPFTRFVGERNRTFFKQLGAEPGKGEPGE